MGRGQTRRSLLAGGAGRGLAGSVVVALPTLACGGQAKEAESKPSAAAPVTIDMGWEQTTNDMGLFVNGQARQIFEQRHPGVTLNVVDQGNVKEKILAQSAAGTPPHILHLAVALPTFYATKDMLTAIDGLVQKDKDAKKADFAPNMWEAFTVRGKQYALPREAGPTVLYYNKSLVAAGGASTPTENWTLATEFKDAAVKLSKPDSSVFGTDVGNWRNWLWSNGGDILDAGLTKYVMDQPAAVEALQLFQDFRYRYKAATLPQDNSALGPIPRFIAGGIALLPQLRSAGNNKGFVQPNVGIALHPKGKGGRKFVMPGNGVAIMKPNKATDISWEVAKWYVSPEFQKLHYKAGIGGVVARLAVLQSEEYLTSAIPRDWNEFFAKGVPDLKLYPKLTNWPEMDDLLNKELTPLQNGQETAAAATARIAPLITSLLKEAEKG